MGRKITPSVSEYAQEFQRPVALRDVRKQYDDDELKRSTHQASMSIVIRQQEYLLPRQGTRKGCHYYTTEQLRRLVYSSERACPSHVRALYPPCTHTVQ